jgi:predicted DNA-binding WGR domain protein
MAARPDELRSPIKHYRVLHRIDPEQGVARFYSLMIERDLFGTVRLVRNWGRIGTNGKEMIEIFADEITAEQALEAVARAKGEGILGSLIAAECSGRRSLEAAAQEFLHPVRPYCPPAHWLISPTRR